MIEGYFMNEIGLLTITHNNTLNCLHLSAEQHKQIFSFDGCSLWCSVNFFGNARAKIDIQQSYVNFCKSQVKNGVKRTRILKQL
jgi:hypothetical protein